MTAISLQGRSRSYEFSLFHVDAKLGPGPGCYVFAKKETRGDYSIVYIGATKDLSERFDSHHKAQCIRRKGARWTGICRTGSREQAQRIEADLLNFYDPPCNG